MITGEKKILMGMSGDKEILLLPNMANRHGFITGATGTGKTVSMQSMAESFSQLGVPVFVADIKGDFSGIANKGSLSKSVAKRVEKYALGSKGFEYQNFPVQFWDIYGRRGSPARSKIEDMGPDFLARLLTLNDVQSSVLAVVFKIAQDKEFPLTELKDISESLRYVDENSKELQAVYGNISSASLGAIQRNLLSFASDALHEFFAEPALDIQDLFKVIDGKGQVNILSAQELILAPNSYATFLMWLLDKIYRSLPEKGDADKPEFVFFFDEAHLLFKDTPKVFINKVDQIVRLVRSKGVGVYFVSQKPSDIPDEILSQLGNRIQHALRAYTPKDKKSLKAAADSFRENPSFNTLDTLTELGTGEALLSFLDEKGAPSIVERADIVPPQSQIGALKDEERIKIIAASEIYEKYLTRLDNISAAEIISESREKKNLEKDLAGEMERLSGKSSSGGALSTKSPEARGTLRKSAEEKAEEKAAEKTAERAARAEEKRQSKRESAVLDTVQKILVPLAKDFLKGLFKIKK